MIFGQKTESAENVTGKSNGDGDCSKDDSEKNVQKQKQKQKRKRKRKRKRKGHGRNGADAYTGAEKNVVAHSELKSGDKCPDCLEGKVYKERRPKVFIRVIGQSPITATVHEMERFRCNLCGKVFTARVPDEVGDKKYDETARAMIALLKYGTGVPFYRLQGLQQNLGIPLSASVQWEEAEKAADCAYPAYQELLRLAAQGEVIHNDDTHMKVLEIMKSNNDDRTDRKGIFTTGILSCFEGKKVALFFTGRRHAGENLNSLLEKREYGLDPPIQMCDALSRNLPEDFMVILANCLSHARRNFVDVHSSFPEKVGYVIEMFSAIYLNDKITKEQSMTKDERLKFHQERSASVMASLKQWMEEQFDEKKVEPNSSLGKAISYMLKRWDPLTLFLRVAGAPLDNNLCEQILKKSILHRKNSMFYKTEHGAFIGDLFMSLIHTCTLSSVNPFEYLTELQRNSKAVFKNPSMWLPWNYKAQIVLHPNRIDADMATACI